MDKHPKIIKRRRTRIIEPKADSMPIGESSVELADEPVESAEPAVLEQTIESLEALTPVEDCSASNAYPSPCIIPQFSQWHSELREIEWDLSKDIWESCPYD